MKCRDGHDSDDDDFCSVCGIAMGAPRRAAARPRPSLRRRTTPRPPAAGGPNACPSCGEPRTDTSARFCEVCRFDFVSKAPGPPPAAAAQAPRAPTPTPMIPKAQPAPPSAAVPASRSSAMPVQWELVVTADPALDTEPDPTSPCPKDAPERVYPFDKSELLVGREDDRRDIHPDIEVPDPGASRRHAKFARMADGGVALQDLASTNGTKLNGTEVASGSRHALKEGDRVTLGRWTSIVLRGRA
jgi:hypothetical protein